MRGETFLGKIILHRDDWLWRSFEWRCEGKNEYLSTFQTIKKKNYCKNLAEND